MSATRTATSGQHLAETHASAPAATPALVADKSWDASLPDARPLRHRLRRLLSHQTCDPFVQFTVVGSSVILRHLWTPEGQERMQDRVVDVSQIVAAAEECVGDIGIHTQHHVNILSRNDNLGLFLII